MKTLNKFILTLLLSSFILLSCKEEILIEPSDNLGIVSVTSDGKKPFVNIPYESIFTVTVNNPSGVKLYGNTNEFKDPTGKLKATILTNTDLLNPSNTNKIYIKVTGTPETTDKEEIKIKLTKNDSLYGANGNKFIFEPIHLQKEISTNNLYQNIQFFEALYKANRSGADFFGKTIKVSELTGTYERAFFGSKLLTDFIQVNLLNDAIEAQNEFNRMKNTTDEFTFKIELNAGQYDFNISNRAGTNYFEQVITGIMDVNSKKYKSDIQISIDPTSWVSKGIEKIPININAVKTLLANLTESELKDAKESGKNLDVNSFKIDNTKITPTSFIKIDTTLIKSMIGNFKTVEKTIFPVQTEVFFKFGDGFLVNYPESFLKKENDVVVFRFTTSLQSPTDNTKKLTFKILYRVVKSKIDPTKLIYQAHFQEE